MKRNSNKVTNSTFSRTLSIVSIVLFTGILILGIKLYFLKLNEKQFGVSHLAIPQQVVTDCQTEEEKKLILKEEAIDKFFNGHFIDAYNQYRSIKNVQDDDLIVLSREMQFHIREINVSDINYFGPNRGCLVKE